MNQLNDPHLIQMLKDIGLIQVTECTPEEAQSRYQMMCRVAYRLVREALGKDGPAVSGLFGVCSERLFSDDASIAAQSALFMEMFRNYILLNEVDDPVLFKDDIIRALDMAVINIHAGMQEKFDDPSSEPCLEDGLGESPQTS